MDIPLNAKVHCTDGLCGHSTYIVVNPITEQVTHWVMKEKRLPHTERLVPVEFVTETTPELIRLRCSGEELEKLEPFIETEFTKVEIPSYVGYKYVTFPYALPAADWTTEKSEWVTTKHEAIPPDELAVRRGAKVEATDGPVGQVDEFLVDPTTQHVTHLIMREGHIWGKRDVTIPVSQIHHFEQDAVYLKLDKEHIEALPTIPVHGRAA
jgi:hypothetical protein